MVNKSKLGLIGNYKDIRILGMNNNGIMDKQIAKVDYKLGVFVIKEKAYQFDYMICIGRTQVSTSALVLVKGNKFKIITSTMDGKVVVRSATHINFFRKMTVILNGQEIVGNRIHIYKSALDNYITIGVDHYTFTDQQGKLRQQICYTIDEASGYPFIASLIGTGEDVTQITSETELHQLVYGGDGISESDYIVCSVSNNR